MIKYAYIVNRTDMDIGQWIRFSKDLTNSSFEEKETLYAKNRHFLVIVREDELSDPGRCLLMDVAGKIYDYCPSLSFLSSSSGEIISLSESIVEIVPREELLSNHSEKMVRAAEQIAKERLKKLSSYFEKSPTARFFGSSPMHRSRL